LCKAWLRKCRENHPGCGPPSARTLPTRLLFLGEEVPRLVVTASIQDEIEYATLSHCWGTLKFTTLTSKTLTDFQTAIPVDALTKTFKEAISIAKYLDIEYLWIDSLCIIQDSAEDWRRESSLMGQVYGYADLNIAATAAADGSGGCFFDRNPSWRCQIRTGEGVGWTLWDCWRDGWKNPTSNSLLPRAWVVQERYLSRRVLHFTDDQVYWECERCPACEIYPSGYPADQKRDHYPEGFQYRKKPLGLGTWSRMVDAYSAAKLTKYSDRYAAIEGPARMIHAELGWEFVAGMWKQDLERQLCWAASLRLVNTPCTIGRSPSWSWMSVKGKIKADEPCDNVTHLAVEVDSLDVEYVSGNMFDGAERAVLRLRCEHLFRGVIKDIHPKHQKDDAQTEVDAGKSSPSEATTKPHFARSFLVGLSQAWGLVLQATGKGTGQYRRIGAFQPTRILRHDVNAVLERMFKQTDCVALEQTECFAATKMREGEALMCYIDVV
ncbi:heterokaryon incompatibility protein-domain-containing protein, partial [Thelonectria olida]